MADTWHFFSDTYVNCNCDANCGCQFNLTSTHGHCEFVGGGRISDGRFNDTDLTGLHWAMMIRWPGEIPEGNGTALIIIDERADADQAEAVEKIASGAVGAPGSNHFSVFASTCSEFLPTQHLPIELDVDIEARTASLRVPGLIESTGEPMINEFDGKPFHIAIARPEGSFEYTWAEIGAGASRVEGDLPMQMEGTYGQFCRHRYNQDGLVDAA